MICVLQVKQSWSYFYIHLDGTAWAMKLSAAISEAFLIFPCRDWPVCCAVTAPCKA